MRLLHTSDWHLGKKLESFSRLKEQKAVMQEICDIADKKQVDAIVVAGDIFDTFNPPVEAIELFYKTVRKLSNNGLTPVIVIAGNHDSPDRIEAPDPLARELGIIFLGYPNSVKTKFELESGLSLSQTAEGFIEFTLPNKELLRIITTPYANEQRLKSFLGIEDKDQKLRDILQQKWQQTADKYCDNKGVNILLTHLFVTKKGQPQQSEPDDEKPILHIGGAQAIYSSAIPKQIQYTALGHLHKNQLIDPDRAPIVYCGTPIAYSFSETNQKKCLVIVDIKAGEQANYEFIELLKGKKLLQQKFTSINDCLLWLEQNQNTLVEITLEMASYLTADEKKSLYDAHSGIVNIIPRVNKKSEQTDDNSNNINLNDNITDLFKQYFASRHGNQQPNDELIDLLKEMIAS
ncbi:MAG: exonuclease subunit SbcD [Pseudomonadota bacterium]